MEGGFEPKKDIGRDDDHLQIDLDASYRPIEEEQGLVEEKQNLALEVLSEVSRRIEYGEQLLALIEENKNIISKNIHDYTETEMEIIELIAPYLSKTNPENLKNLEKNIQDLKKTKEKMNEVLDDTILTIKTNTQILKSLKDTPDPTLN